MFANGIYTHGQWINFSYTTVSLIMLVSGIIVLAALCGFALGAGDPTLEINLEKASVVNVDNPITGEWSATLEPGKPQNKLTLKTPMKADMPDNLMIKFEFSINDSPLPSTDIAACDGFNDEIAGKDIVAAGNPFPKKCPVAKGEYHVVNYVPNKDRMPPGLPDGNFKGSATFYVVGKDPYVIVNFEGTIKHGVPGMG